MDVFLKNFINSKIELNLIYYWFYNPYNLKYLYINILFS